MRLKAKHDSYCNGFVGLPCDFVVGNTITVYHGYADVEPKDEDGFIAAMEAGVYPLGAFRLAHPEEAPPVRTTALLSAKGQDADTTKEGLTWLSWTESIKVGFTAKSLKEAALLGLVRSREVDEKTVYCGEDLETVKAKRAR